MIIKTKEDFVLEYPISITWGELVYINMLNKGNEKLYLQKDNKGTNSFSSLRGRKYATRTPKVMEEEIDTVRLNGLISKGFLLKTGENGDYHELSPNKLIISYSESLRKNAQKDEVLFTMEFPSLVLDNKTVAIKKIRKLDSNEKQKLLKNKKVLSFDSYPVKVKALENGINEPSLFILSTSKSFCYMIIGDKKLIQVYPKESKKQTEDKDKIKDVVFDLSDTLLSIYSLEFSTNYIREPKAKFEEIQDIIDKLKVIRKLAKEHDVKVRGYSKVELILRTQEESYNRYKSEYNEQWEQISSTAKALEKVGIYKGGQDNNPLLKQLNIDKENLRKYLNYKPVLQVRRLNEDLTNHILDIPNGNLVSLKIR